MNRPTFLHIGGVLYWTMRTRNPDTMVLKDADSTPTVTIRKNGSAVGDSVTVTKRSATTGIYDCSYNPAGEVEGDEFTVEETIVMTGTTTSQATYSSSWGFTILALERGTDNAPTASANATQVRAELTAELARLDANVSTRLASGSYSDPPSASSIASAVQSQLNDDFASLASAIGDIDPAAVTVAPLSATRPTKVKGSNIETYVGDTDPIRIAIWSGASGTTPVDLEALRPLTLVIADKTSKAVIQTIEDGDLDIDTTNYLTFTPSALAVEEEAIHRWSLRKANGAVIGRGDFGVFWEPIKETE